MFRNLLILVFVLLFHGKVAPVGAIQDVDENYGLAAGHYERQEYELAAEKFRGVIERFPSTRQAASSYFFLGESLVQSQDYRSAFPAYQIFLRRLPQDSLATRAHFRMAECAFRLGWEQRAAELLERFVAEFPEDSLNEFALAYLGELRLKRDEPQLALRVFERALQKYPNSVQATKNRLGLAKALRELSRFEEAQKFFELITSDPTNPWAAEAQLQIGVVKFQLAKFEAAKKSFADTIATASDNSDLVIEASVWLAKTEMALRNFDAAFTQYMQVVDSTTNQKLKIAILFDGALAASKVGKSDTALQWLNRLRNTWPENELSDDALKLEIELLYRQKNFQQALAAIAVFEKELNDQAMLPLVLEFKGRIQYELAKHAETAKIFQKLLTDFGSEPVGKNRRDTWSYFLGLAQIGQQQFQRAADTLDALRPTDTNIQFLAAVLLAKASAASGLERFESTVVYLEQYLALDFDHPNRDRALSELIIAYAKTNRWSKLDNAMETFSSTTKDRSVFLDSVLYVGECALKNKRYEQAESCFRLLTDSANPRKYVVRGLSGIAWTEMSRGEERTSVEVFKRLIDEYSETPFAAEAALVSGKLFEEQGRFEDAFQMYELIHNRFPDSKFVTLSKLRMATCLTETQDDSRLGLAEALLSDLVAQESEFQKEAQYALAWIYNDSQRPELAFNLFAALAEDKTENPYWCDAAYRVAKKHIDEGQFEKAQPIIAQLENESTPIEIQTRIHFLSGQLAVQTGQWDRIHELMSRVLADCDDELLRKQSRYWLAESLYQTEKYEQAKSEFAKLTENPDLVSVDRRAWSALRQSQCYSHLEEWSAALELASSAKRKYPEFVAQYEFDFTIGRAHAAQGRLREARAAFRRVIQSELGRSTETAAMAQWRIGESFFHQENYERAIEAFYKVDSLYGYTRWRAAALLEAGKCQEYLGNWNHAAKLYSQLIEKYPNSQFCNAAQEHLNTAHRQAKRTTSKHRK